MANLTQTLTSESEPREVKASGSYELVRPLVEAGQGAQAYVELVEKVRGPPKFLWATFRSSNSPKTLCVRKSYRIGVNEPRSMIKTRKKHLWNEYIILRKLDHPNIVKYVDFEYQEKPNMLNASIYMEYCDKGDLSQYVKYGISASIHFQIFYQLTVALFYCHTGLNYNWDSGSIAIDSEWTRPVLHRDIKPANIIVSHEDATSIVVKLCDFGLAKYQRSTLTGSMVGTPGYIAPEINDEIRDWTPKADIYSLGKTMQTINCQNPGEPSLAVIKQCVDSHVIERISSSKLLEILCTQGGKQTPLSSAMGNEDKKIVKLFLERCEIGLKLKDGATVSLLLNTAQSDGMIFDMLLQRCQAENILKDEFKQMVLSWTAEKDNTGEVGIDSKCKIGRTPLSYAAQNGYVKVVKLLLDTGQVEADSRDQNNRTPLLWAARNGHEAIVKLLLDTSKVDVSLKDEGDQEAGHKGGTKGGTKGGQTPLSWAARNGHETVVKLLLEAKADIESKDANFGRTPLSCAAKNGHEAVVKLLLKAKAGIDLKDTKFGRTPLSWAARNGHEAVIKLLLKAKANVDSKDAKFGQTPLSGAAENGHEAVVKLLAEANADIDSKDNCGWTPLSWAAGTGHESVVKLLVEANADIDSKDDRGGTPLSWAKRKGHETIVKLLLEAKGEPDEWDSDSDSD